MTEPQLPSNYRLSLKALIYDEAGRILLVNEKRDHWDLPGGGPNHGETPEEALRREIREELGVEVASFSVNPVFVWFFHLGDSEHYACWLTYEVVIVGEPTTTDHTSAVQYHSLDNMNSAVFGDYFNSALDDLMSYRPNMIQSSQASSTEAKAGSVE